MTRSHPAGGLVWCLAAAVSTLHACGLIDTDRTGSVVPDPALTRIRPTSFDRDDPPNIVGGGYYGVTWDADAPDQNRQYVSIPYDSPEDRWGYLDYPIQLDFWTNGVVELHLIWGVVCPETESSYQWTDWKPARSFYKLATLFAVPAGEAPVKDGTYNLAPGCPENATAAPEWYVDNTREGWWMRPGQPAEITKLDHSRERLCEGPKQWFSTFARNNPDDHVISFHSRTQARDALEILPELVQAFVNDKMRQMITNGCGPVLPTD